MRIYNDNCISVVIETQQHYPFNSLVAVDNGDNTITVFLQHVLHQNQTYKVLNNINFNIIQDINGNTFPNITDTVNYLNKEFNPDCRNCQPLENTGLVTDINNFK